MPPKELIFGILIFAILLFNFSTFDSSKKQKKKHYRSLKSPVVSNAELFDAFSNQNDIHEKGSDIDESK